MGEFCTMIRAKFGLGPTAKDPKMQLEESKVLEHCDMQGGYRLLVLDAPGIAPGVQPGQFVHLRIPHLESAVLRRPFSVFKAEGRSLSILYKSVGRGTQVLKSVSPGEAVHLIGPLGHGFPTVGAGRVPVLIAGGYGMAALYLVAKSQPVKGIVFVGGRSAADILCVRDFEALGWPVRVATEDGSLGAQGLVTAALEAWLAGDGRGRTPEFFACGPNGMLKAIGARASAGGWTAWLSMDRHMACGVGACLTCVQKIRTPDGGWIWERICREGPVFESRQVVWEE